ncbi:MAG: MarR family transcriptional regulator [Oceanicaulis sp.]
MADNAQLIEKLGGAPDSKTTLRLWLRLLTCAHHIESGVRDGLRRDFATTLPRFDVLAALDRFPDGLTMGELSRWLLVSNGNVTGLVTRLESEGLIEKVRSAADRRSTRVKLTNAGSSTFAEMAHAHEGWIDQLFAGLDAGEAEQLLDLLGRLKDSLAAAKHQDAP